MRVVCVVAQWQTTGVVVVGEHGASSIIVAGVVVGAAAAVADICGCGVGVGDGDGSVAWITVVNSARCAIEAAAHSAASLFRRGGMLVGIDVVDADLCGRKTCRR